MSGGYKQHIVWATHCDARNVDAIEGVMRDQNDGVLDNLSLDEFVALARTAHRAVTWMREQGGHDDVLAHFGAVGA